MEAEAAAKAAAEAEAEAEAEAGRWPPSVPSTPRTGAQYGASTVGFVPVAKAAVNTATPAVAAAANMAALAPPPRTQLEAKAARRAEHALAAATQVMTP